LGLPIKNRGGELFGTWSEYIFSTIKAVNDRYAKKILLFLSKERYKECTREEISNHLGGKLPELEKKLRALEYGDLITQGTIAALEKDKNSLQGTLSEPMPLSLSLSGIKGNHKGLPLQNITGGQNPCGCPSTRKRKFQYHPLVQRIWGING